MAGRKSAVMIHRNLVGAVLVLLMAGPGTIQYLALQTRDVSRFVTDVNGKAINDVLIIRTSGLHGWTSSQQDGSFSVLGEGQFISFRAAGYRPELLRVNSSATPLRVTLRPADNTVQNAPICTSLPNKGKAWVGGGLKVRPPGRYEGPVSGQHDAHWYVPRGKDSLHIVDGAMWHSGLPVESDLLAVKDIAVRAWHSRTTDTVILDLSGQRTDGKYWRWVGAPLATAVNYETSDRSTAEYFDAVIASLCVAGPGR